MGPFARLYHGWVSRMMARPESKLAELAPPATPARRDYFSDWTSVNLTERLVRQLRMATSAPQAGCLRAVVAGLSTETPSDWASG